MGDPPDSPERRYATIVEALLSHPGVTHAGEPARSKQRFGSRGELKARGRIFTFFSKGKLVVKLPRQRVDTLIATGRGERYDPGHGRLMKEWLAAPSSDEGWLSLAREALAFVASKD